MTSVPFKINTYKTVKITYCDNFSKELGNSYLKKNLRNIGTSV